MRKFGVCLASIGATLCLAGCGTQFGGQSSSTRGGIAVVDLDKVATETGKSIEMKEAIQGQENALKLQLLNLRNGAVTQLQAEAKKLLAQEQDADATEEDKKTTEDAKRSWAVKNQNANTNLASAQNKAASLLSDFQQAQVSKFRAELKPIVQEAAAKRGLSVVIPKNEGLLLTVDPGVDITAEVIKAYQAKRLAAPAATSTPAAPTTAQAAPTTTTK